MAVMSTATTERGIPAAGIRGRWIGFFSIAAVVAVADQLSKAWVSGQLSPRPVERRSRRTRRPDPRHR